VGVAYASGDVNSGGQRHPANWFLGWQGLFLLHRPPARKEGRLSAAINDEDQISGY